MGIMKNESDFNLQVFWTSCFACDVLLSVTLCPCTANLCVFEKDAKADQIPTILIHMLEHQPNFTTLFLC